MIADGDEEVVGAPVVQEEDALAEPPERRGTELIRPRGALDGVLR